MTASRKATPPTPKRWHLDGFIGVHPLGDLYRVVEP